MVVPLEIELYKYTSDGSLFYLLADSYTKD